MEKKSKGNWTSLLNDFETCENIEMWDDIECNNDKINHNGNIITVSERSIGND